MLTTVKPQLPPRLFSDNQALMSTMHQKVATVLKPRLRDAVGMRQELLQREAEKKLLSFIANGDVAAIDDIIDYVDKNGSDMNVERMSDHEVQQARYEVVSMVTLFCRTVTDNGFPELLAYAISDCYIQGADRLVDATEIRVLLFSAMREFTQAMRDYKLPDCSQTVRACCEYINYHLNTAITMQELGEFCGFSPNYISDLFFKELGLRPTQYIRAVKLEYARILLRDPQQSVTEVAEMLAFPSASTFAAQFKARFGVTPKAYQLQQR